MINYNHQNIKQNIPKELQALLIINLSIFILSSICDLIAPTLMVRAYSIFGLVPENFFQKYYIWQPFTYMFLHGSEMHIFFNMLVLWFLGNQINKELQGTDFLTFYIFTGASAGIITLIVNSYLSIWYPIKGLIPTVGASGSIYALLTAFAIFYPNRKLYLYFLFPITARWLVIVISIYSTLSFIYDLSSGTSHIAHLAGLISGVLYIKSNPIKRILQIRIKFTRSKPTAEDAFSNYYAVLDKLNNVGWDALDEIEQNRVIEYHELVKKNEQPN